MPARPARRITRRPSPLGAIAIIAVAALGVAACSSTTESSSPTSAAPSTTAPATTTTTPPGKDAVLFATVGGNIDVYQTQPPFHRERVVAAGTAPNGGEPHGQICFFPDGSRRFVVAESTPASAAGPAVAGWGVYQLTGDDVGTYRVARVGGFTSPSASSAPAPTTYGCAFTKAGQLFTTDVGNQAGAGTGQLIEWFGPFTAPPSGGQLPLAHCTIATGLASPGGLALDPDGSIDLASSRAPTAGVWKYNGQLPKDAASCTPAAAAAPASGGVTASGVTASILIAAGPNGLGSPTAVAVSADAKSLFVSSTPDGTIDQFDLHGQFTAAALQPKAGEQLGATPRASGTPYGIAVNGDGNLFYADSGLILVNGLATPGPRLGSIRRISFAKDQPQPPELVNQSLDAPDGLGIFDPAKAGGGSASVA
jgi:hypothetical protein